MVDQVFYEFFTLRMHDACKHSKQLHFVAIEIFGNKTSYCITEQNHQKINVGRSIHMSFYYLEWLSIDRAIRTGFDYSLFKKRPQGARDIFKRHRSHRSLRKPYSYKNKNKS